ncbi:MULTISPECIES: SRPBCC family protein [unclassified Agrococcus]|uniref:SRPBCC family protein n=1 Tax=unclassified Agrococcus TaxID=2615065 RepID=UPI00360A8DE7
MRVRGGRIHLAVGGPIDPDLAWERYARTDRWTWWARHLRAVEVDGDDEAPRIHPGLTGRVVAIGGLVARFRVDAVDERARTWSWTVRVGPVRLRLAHSVVAATQVGTEREGTLTRLVLRGPLPVTAAYAPVAAWALARLVRR